MICWYTTHRIISCVTLSTKEHAVAQTRELLFAARTCKSSIHNYLIYTSPPLGSKHPDFSESGRIKCYRKCLSPIPPSPNKNSPVTKEVLSPAKTDSKINDLFSAPESSLKINVVSKECCSKPEPQGLTLPHPPVSNNLISSVTSQPPYQVAIVISSNKSQQIYASHPLTPNLPISSLQLRQNVNSALHHTNTNVALIPPPLLGSKHPDFSESGRTKCYKKSSSQSTSKQKITSDEESVKSTTS